MHFQPIVRPLSFLSTVLCLALSPLSACHHSPPPAAAAKPMCKGAPCAKCRALQEQWPSMVEACESAAATKDTTQARQRAEVAGTSLAAFEANACPLWQRRAKQQRALLDDLMGMHDTLHAADSSAFRTPELDKRFWQLHHAACLAASKNSAQSFAVYAESQSLPEAQRRQRYVVNLPNDAATLAVSGAVGPVASEAQWTGLVLTEVLEPVRAQLSVLQGQGPQSAEAAQAYVQGTLAYAAAHHLPQVLFVNAAGGQVQPLGATVQAAAQGGHAPGVDLQFLELTDWTDGALVTPQRAAQIAVGIADRLALRQGPSLLVVNCNAGLDRSGTLNALVQLVALTQKRLHLGVPAQVAVQEAESSIDTVVAALKEARGHAISSPARYAFIHAAYLAYAQSLTPVSAPAGGAAR